MINGAGRVLVGVHSGGATTVGVSSSIPFDVGLQNRLGGLYLSPHIGGSGVLGENPSTGAVEVVAVGSAQQTTVSYDPSNKRLWMNGRCLSAVSGGFPASLARLDACNAAAPSQRWDVDPAARSSTPRRASA